MNVGLKQRLVGAIVLVCITLILWPVLFSDATGPIVDKRSQIPPMPEFEKFTVPEPERPAAVVPAKERTVEEALPMGQAPIERASIHQAPVDQTSTMPAPSAAVPVVKKEKPTTAVAKIPSKPALDSQGLPEAWSLQVASFSNSKNAGDLKADLQKQGYKAYTRTVQTKAGEVVRVYIGPKMTREAFDKDRPLIDKKYNLKSIVVKFEQ